MKYDYPQSGGGWHKHPDNPVFGDAETGSCFDVQVMPTTGGFRMYFSWRNKMAIACMDGPDGIHWGEPRIVLGNNLDSGWEDDVNRHWILEDDDGRILMWYTGQARKRSLMGLAASDDGGRTFRRCSEEPIMIPEFPWEKESVMNPCVLKENGIYRMWYAAGETHEPNALGYAESTDALHWRKSLINPIFCRGSEPYERERIGGCEVHRLPGGRYVMFYIGYEDIHTARICAAISPDGVHRWERLPGNPLISPGEGCWDADACYKPSLFRDEANQRWLLWYNGRTFHSEYIGMAVHPGLELA